MNERYDAVADDYASTPDLYNDPASLALFGHIGSVRGKHVLDLACGHGRIARELARKGADVIGVDISEALLEKASQLEEREPLGIRYVHSDVSKSDSLSGQSFDEVVCSFGLTDIDDLNGAAATISRVLKPAGGFTFSMLHPCFPGGKDVSGSWPSDGTYYEEKYWLADGALSLLRKQVGANHRMLSTYLNILRTHRLLLERVSEPEPSEGWSDKRGDAGRFPVFLVGRCRREHSSG